MNESAPKLNFSDIWEQALSIWVTGGWAMVAIAFIALVMFTIGMNMYFKLASKGVGKIKEKTWRNWIDQPELRKGKIGAILDFVTASKSLSDMSVFFSEIRATEIAPFDRDLKVMKICVGTAPLVGLLGTVTGMLTTFDALSSGSGGEKTMSSIASGISEALVTTMTGLVVALPGLFFQYQLARKNEKYKSFLSHVETVCTQKLYKKLKKKVA